MNLVTLYEEQQLNKHKLNIETVKEVIMIYNKQIFVDYSRSNVFIDEVFCSVYRNGILLYDICKSFFKNCVAFDPPLQKGDVVELSYRVLVAK
jgi:hypothetical protein